MSFADTGLNFLGQWVGFLMQQYNGMSKQLVLLIIYEIQGDFKFGVLHRYNS